MRFPFHPQFFHAGPLFSITFPRCSFIFEKFFKVTTVVVARAGNDTLSVWKEGRRSQV
jgi:hypothetical protein